MPKQIKAYLSRQKVATKLLLMLVATAITTAVFCLLVATSVWQFIIQNQIEPSFIGNLEIITDDLDDINQANNLLPKIQKLNKGSIDISWLGTFDADGQLQAYYGMKNFDRATQLHDVYSHFISQSVNNHLHPIILNNKHQIQLLIIYNYKSSELFTTKFIAMAIILFLIAALMIRAIQLQSQRWLIKPLLHLKSITHQVSTHQNYSVRANKVYFDEVGNLVDAFNAMLSQIQARDQLLTDARDKSRKAQKEAEQSSVEIKQTNIRLEEEARIRSLMEAKLLEVQDFLNGIINAMPSVMIALTPRYRITLWNEQAEKLTHIKSTHAINHRIDDAFPFMLFYLDLVHQANQTGEVKTVNQAELQIAGQTRYFSIMIYPLKSHGLDDVVIKLDDITDQKHLQEMVVQSEKMMSLGGLAAGMAHEINNPLGGILQNLQNLTRRLSSSLPKNKLTAEEHGLTMAQIEGYLNSREIPALIENINRAGHRAVDIVTNMLQFSRNADPKLEPYNLNELTKQAIQIAKTERNLNQLCSEYDLVLLERYDPALGAVPCIQSEIEQVIINLLKNAAQSLIDKIKQQDITPQIHVLVSKIDNMAVIEVRDNGLGMDERTRKRVFEPFFTTKETGKGTGLGLSVSYFIISSHHHGVMDVQSEPGVGTSFFIRLPIRALRIQAE
jgi:signal transduction histidine kinase/HAMP domain-containing protein